MAYGRMGGLHGRGDKESRFVVGNPGPIKVRNESKYLKQQLFIVFFHFLKILFIYF